MPKTTLLAWSASFDGAGKPRPSLAKWLDVLPGPAADRVREDLGLGAVDATAEATADAARPDAVLALRARDFLLAELPVASELVLGIVRGEDGRLAPLAVFDVADSAQAEALATRLFDTGARKALPWRSISSDGMRLRYVDLGELIAASGGHIKGTAEAGFDLRLGYGIHDGLFVVGGVDAVYGFLAARAGREPRLGEAIDTRGVDAENALELTVQLGAFAHGPPSPVPPIAAAQAALARALPPSASYSLSARLAPRRVRVRTNAPLLALAAWLRLVERPASPEPEPEPEPGPLPEPVPVPEPPSDDAGTPLTEAQLAWPLETASGARTTLAELPRDKALLVTFWATYCTPCVEQLPVLTAAAADLGPGWQLVHLSSDDSWEPLRALAAREGSPLPSLEAPLVLRDSHGMGTAPDDTLRGSFGTTLMPDSVVIYGGRVIERFVNTQPWTSLALESQLMKVAARAGLPLPVPTPDDVEAARRALDGGTPQVSDTFDRTTLGAWESDGGWSVVDGELRGGGVGSSPVWLATPLPDAVRIELSVTSSSGDFDCVLADRATPGEALVLPRRYEPGRRYRWALVRRGPSLYWLVDGELALARADARTPPGASLGCASQAPMSIDDVSVFALAP
ncbi:MAG: TlpA disulfide reductase family protein [Myxococcota bacterium]